MKTVAMISPNENAASETFIRAQRDLLRANVKFYYGEVLPTFLEGKRLLNHPLFAGWSIFRKKTIYFLRKSALTNSFREQKIDVCFAHYGPTAVEMLPICKELKIPLIVHFHGYDISIKDVLNGYIERYKKVFEYASYIIAISKPMRQKIIDLAGGGDEISKKVIYNPAAPNDVFFDIKPSYSQKLFVGVGRFVDKKAPYATILAFKKTLEKHPDAKLVLPGSGLLYDVCKELVNYFGLQDSISLPGAFTREYLENLLSNALCFVQHSLTAGNGDMEGMPVTVLEASAAGLPVISTFHAGIPDVIIDGKTGLLVQERDIDGMAEKMLFILDNPEKAKEMGMAGKENIRANFTMKRQIDVLNDIVEKVSGLDKQSNSYPPKFHPPQNFPIELTKQEKMIIDYVIENKLTMVSKERLFATLMSCKYVIKNNIDGDFVECGVWRGGNSIIAAWMFKLYKSNRKVYLYDTFQGMTSPANIDTSFDGQSAKEQFAARKEWCYASLEDVKANFTKLNLLSQNVVFVQGDVLKTLDEIIPESISVLRLDTDWYESTKKEMEILYEKLSLNGAFLIDDYGHWKGSQKAVDEYFEKNGKRPFLHYTDYTGRTGIKI